jgi:hypothetical protein
MKKSNEKGQMKKCVMEMSTLLVVDLTVPFHAKSVERESEEIYCLSAA